MRRESDIADIVLGVMLAFGLVCLGLAVSGCGGNSKQTALKGAMAVLDTAKAGLEIYDQEKQVQLVEKSESREDLLLKIQRYRAKRAPLLEMLTVAYKTIAVAALNPSDVKIEEVLKLIEELKEAIERFKRDEPEPESDSDEDEDPEISTGLAQGDVPCRRPFATLSSFYRSGRRFEASSRVCATDLFLTAMPSQPELRL